NARSETCLQVRPNQPAEAVTRIFITASEELREQCTTSESLTSLFMTQFWGSWGSTRVSRVRMISWQYSGTRVLRTLPPCNLTLSHAPRETRVLPDFLCGSRCSGTGREKF